MATTTISLESLCRELDLGWSQKDLLALEAELEPYSRALYEHLESGAEIATHVRGTRSICAPVTPITDPHELFATAAGDVQGEAFKLEEYDDYRVTLHYSDVHVPVVMLLLKENRFPLTKFEELCERCGQLTGFKVGGPTGAYIQWNGPKFSWALHTDDDFEGVDARIHVPLITTPLNFIYWAESLDAKADEFLLEKHLERGKVYQICTNVPHTAMNKHPTDGRLHLIVDVTREPYTGA